MALHIDHSTKAMAMGIIGNIISGLVYLSPLPTYMRIYKKQSTEGFQSLPYVVALFSSMLWLYYAVLKGNDYYLITINVIGCIVETIYIAVYYLYAPRKVRIRTVRLTLLLNLGLFSLIGLVTRFLVGSSKRGSVLGIISGIVSTAVFAAPLTILAKVVRTRSVEYMPFALSFFLTLNGATWFFYGLLQKDLCISVPNIIGFVFGVLQMVVYAVYKYCFVEENSTTALPTKEGITELESIPPPEADGRNGEKDDEEKESMDMLRANGGVEKIVRIPVQLRPT